MNVYCEMPKYRDSGMLKCRNLGIMVELIFIPINSRETPAISR